MTHPPPDVKKTIMSNCLLKSPVEQLLSSTQTAARSRAAAERVANQSYLAVYEPISAHHTVGKKKVSAWRMLSSLRVSHSFIYIFYRLCYLSFLVIVLGRVLNSSLGLVDNGKIFKISFLIVCYIHQRVWLFVQIQITIQDSRFKDSKIQE